MGFVTTFDRFGNRWGSLNLRFVEGVGVQRLGGGFAVQAYLTGKAGTRWLLHGPKEACERHVQRVRRELRSNSEKSA